MKIRNMKKEVQSFSDKELLKDYQKLATLSHEELLKQ